MMRTIENNRSGFSLVEMLVYIAVLMFAVTAMVVSFLSLDTSLIRNQAYRELTHTANIVLERMVRDIRAAETANTSVANQLTLVTPNGATTTVYALSGNDIDLTVNGIDLDTINDADVSVDALTFTKYDNVGTELETSLVRVTLTLSVSTNGTSATRTYYTSAVLRGTYE